MISTLAHVPCECFAGQFDVTRRLVDSANVFSQWFFASSLVSRWCCNIKTNLVFSRFGGSIPPLATIFMLVNSFN